MARPLPLFVDHCSTTPPHPAALAEHARVASLAWGNPSSPHGAGRIAARELQRARETLAASLGARPDELVFAASGTEANNLAIQGVIRRELRLRPDHAPIPVIVGADSHASVLEPLRLLDQEFPGRLSILPLPVTQEGLYDWDWLASQMVSAPALLSLLHINNETGVVQDLAQAYSWRLRFPRLVLHVDWVQSQGKWPLDLRLVPPDLLTCSAHKVHGLRGCALLYVRHGLEMDPLVVGGAQEKFRRAGTSDVAAAAAYAEAVRQLPPPGSTWPHLRLLEDTILRHLDESGVSFILHGPTPSPVPKESHPPRRMPGILNMAFPAMANKEDLLIALDLEGICASATSACHSGVVSDSHVLQAMGLPAQERAASIRLALAAHQTPEDAARVADALVRAVRRAETLPRPTPSGKS